MRLYSVVNVEAACRGFMTDWKIIAKYVFLIGALSVFTYFNLKFKAKASYLQGFNEGKAVEALKPTLQNVYQQGVLEGYMQGIDEGYIRGRAVNCS